MKSLRGFAWIAVVMVVLYTACEALHVMMAFRILQFLEAGTFKNTKALTMALAALGALSGLIGTIAWIFRLAGFYRASNNQSFLGIPDDNTSAGMLIFGFCVPFFSWLHMHDVAAELWRKSQPPALDAVNPPPPRVLRFWQLVWVAHSVVASVLMLGASGPPSLPGYQAVPLWLAVSSALCVAELWLTAWFMFALSRRQKERHGRLHAPSMATLMGHVPEPGRGAP